MITMITYDDFKKLDIRIGKIIEAEKIAKSKKLLKLQIDLGEGDPSTGSRRDLRQIIAGIALSYPDPAELIGKEIPILTNLEPKVLMGLTSYGMILAADNEGIPTLLNPQSEVPPGSIVK